tara:strand:- start:3064 stop:4821 length:1758 start_codon:yes stop_codon:yes gene_type:complete
MLKKINVLLTSKLKFKLIFIFVGNLLVTSLEFLSLASVPLAITILLNSDGNNLNLPIVGELFKNVNFDGEVYKIFFIILFFVFLLKNIFFGLILYLEAKFNLEIRTYFTGKLFKKYSDLPYLFHVNSSPGVLIRNLVDEVAHTCSVIYQLLVVFRELLLLTVIVILLSIYNETIVFPILFILGILVFICLKKIKKIIKVRAKEALFRRGQINIKASELIGGIKEIKIKGLNDFALKNFNKDVYVAEYNSFFVKVINSFPRLILEMSSITLIIVLFFIYDYMNYEIDTFLPILSLVAISAVRAIPSIGALVISLNNIIFLSPSVNLIYRDLIEKKGEKLKSEQKTSITLKEHIELKNIFYKYPGRKKLILKNISLKINKGKKVGIIGSSGSGKSTLLNLILGLIHPIKGEVVIDNFKLKEVDVKNWRKQIGYVSQNLFLFDDTLEKNISYGDTKNDKKKLIRSIKKSNLSDFIKNLPLREKTIIGNNGIKVSGGQHQRIGIARALYSNPKILIMDEATSALDFKTEDNIMKDMNFKNSDLTAIIVSHRPRAVKNCDVIYYLENGKVKDFGSFNKLSKKYKKLKLKN